ncbi:MAG TPA: PatB family C-S lyase [Anaerolineaceae bacterium]|nr:PatB family C-S lyase [Anaerolineaceae bacterium]
MGYDFDTVIHRRNTESVKWNAYPEDVLPMWVADMDFISPEPVLRALHERIDHGVFGYPGKSPGLTEAILQWLQVRFHWEVHPEELLIVPGVVTGINWACHALAEPGAGVLVQTPVYPPFLAAPKNTGNQLITTPMVPGPGGQYEVDWDAFEAAASQKPQLFILCSPHNPLGRVFRRDELERMGEICLRQGITICSDEIHADLVYPPCEHYPTATISPEIARNTVTFMAPSKTFNIAGLECSFAVVPDPELRRKLNAGRKGLVGWVNLLGLVAAEAAYREGAPWLDSLLEYLRNNRDFLLETLRREMPQISMPTPEGTYLAWLDCRTAGIPDPYHFFLEHARVGLNDGREFGPGGEGFVRLNFGCPRSVLKEGLDRMKAALERV